MNKRKLSEFSVVIKEIKENKVALAEKVMRSLPDWFGIESAIQNYLKDVNCLPTYFVTNEEAEALGFVCLKFHNQHTAEIQIIAVSPSYHGQGIGGSMIEHAQTIAKQNGCSYLMVKTLGVSRPNHAYDLTRKFYTKMGFLPLEEFWSIWPENPCLIMIKKI